MMLFILHIYLLLKCGKHNFNFNYVLTKEAAALNICFLKRIDHLAEINMFLEITEDEIMEKLRFILAAKARNKGKKNQNGT